MTEESSYTILTLPASQITAAYRTMIYAKWLRSLRTGNDWFKLIHPSGYWSSLQKVIDNILASPDSKIKLAVLSDDHDVVLGFCVYRTDKLDYIYVNKDMRCQKIATHILPADIKVITHLTKCGKQIWKRKYKEWDFNPFV